MPCFWLSHFLCLAFWWNILPGAGYFDRSGTTGAGNRFFGVFLFDLQQVAVRASDSDRHASSPSKRSSPMVVSARSESFRHYAPDSDHAIDKSAPVLYFYPEDR